MARLRATPPSRRPTATHSRISWGVADSRPRMLVDSGRSLHRARSEGPSTRRPPRDRVPDTVAWSTACRLGVVVGGLTLVACSHGPQRADEAVPSLVLRDVFFTNVVTPAGRTYTTTYELGPRLRRFNPDQDVNVVLVTVFDPRIPST